MPIDSMSKVDEQSLPVLSVVAPCYNEEDNVDQLVKRTLATFDRMKLPAELVLIDDGSSDKTWNKIVTHAERERRVRGSRHARNSGMVEAWRSGVTASAGRLVCLIDSDLQNRPEDIALLYDKFQTGGADIVQGVRRPVAGVQRLKMFSRGLSHLLNLSFGTRLKDAKSGFVICLREHLLLTLSHRYSYKWFQCFLGPSAASHGLTIAEIDTVFEPRLHGLSFLKIFPWRASLEILIELIKFRIEVWQRRIKRVSAIPQSRPATQARI